MSNRGKNLRKAAGRLAAAALAMTVLAASALMAHATSQWRQIDTDRTDCSIDLTLHTKNTKTNEDVYLNGGTAAIYRVAGVKVENGYHFDTSTGQFAGNAALTEEALAKLEPSGATDFPNNAELASTLAGAARNVQALSTQNIANGKVSFTGLTAGLYLIVQETITTMNDVDYAFKSFLISIPDGEGNYHVAAYPKPGYEDFQEGEVETESETPSESESESESEPISGETETEPETEKKTEKHTEPPKPPRLPQTGQLWWPVPLLILAGVVLILAGALRKRTGMRR